MLTRRIFCRAPAMLALTSAMTRIGPAIAQEPAWRHGLSLFGALKYPATFKQFDYVNASAPKSGTVRQSAFGTFDNFNMVVAGVKGSLVGGIELIYDTLMVAALDEVSTEYGLLAESVRHPDDFSFVTYRLRAEAKWHDGKPVTPEDVIYSLDSFKEYHPQYASYYRHVAKAEQSGDRDITFTFDQPGNRELPQIVGQLTVLPKHWWQGTDASGNKRSISTTTLEMPLGNGAYRIKEFAAGRSITYERVADYWGRDVNVNIGRDNFAEQRFDYFRDPTVALEAFKGDAVDWRVENSAKNWATAYDFPAVKDQRVLREEFPIRSSGGMQAFAFNTRRAKFSDPRVRRAFNYAMNFEELNKQLFFGQYKRIASYFENLELAARDLPQGLELEILQAVKDQVPPEVFTTPYTNPVSDSDDQVRANLREALKLFRDAGYEIRDQKMTNTKTGEALTAEVLIDAPDWERIVLPYQKPLQRLGVTLTLRLVDDAQYENRLRQWDFDIVVASWGQSLSPGNEQRSFWGSPAADQAGSRNLVGIKNPAVDAMIERLIFAKSREELVAASKALDRVLLWNHYVVPQWTYGKIRSARWDRFGRPETLPEYGNGGFPTIWWWDAAKAAKTGLPK